MFWIAGPHICIRLREFLGVWLLVVLFAAAALAGLGFQPSRHTSGPILQIAGPGSSQFGILVTPDPVPEPEY